MLVFMWWGSVLEREIYIYIYMLFWLFRSSQIYLSTQYFSNGKKKLKGELNRKSTTQCKNIKRDKKLSE